MKKRKILSVISVVLCLVSLFTMTGEAAARTNFGTYVDKYIPTPDVSICPSTQGFATGSKYLYSVKIDNLDSRAVIYRANKDGQSEAEILRNADENNGYYAYGLGHANDMCVTSVNGKSRLYITTSTDKFNNKYDIAVLEITGNTYKCIAKYDILIDDNENGKEDGISGITITDHHYDNDTKIRFLLKSGNNVYTYVINKSDNRVVQEPRYVLRILRNHVYVTRNDTKVTEKISLSTDNFSAQGFDYCKETDTLYFSLGGNGKTSYKNKSIVLAYKNIYDRINPHFIGAPPSPLLFPLNNQTFYVTSNAYSALFEIEGTGISSDGKMYFNANRRVTDKNCNHDVISYFTGFKAF